MSITSWYQGGSMGAIPHELKIRLCGIDAPEVEQLMGIEARDHLWSRLDQGDGTIIGLPIETDRYGRTVAELFVQGVDREEEIHINSQMTYDGYAYHDDQYSDSCPNTDAIAKGEEIAKAARTGVWTNLKAVKPWEYRQQSKAYEPSDNHRKTLAEILFCDTNKPI